MFCTFTSALSVVCVQSPIWLFFCISLTSCFPGMLLRYCPSDFEMVPVAPVITGITFAFTFHRRWISFIRSLYSKIFSASIFITFPSSGIVTPINMHYPFLLSQIICQVYCLKESCQFELFGSITCQPYFHNLFQLILVRGYTSIHCLTLPLSPCIC